MLEDFIESNNLKAKIIDFNSKVKPLCNCFLVLFNNESFLVVINSTKKLDLKKLALALKIDFKRLKLADKEKAFEITGYALNFLPPISIYGVTIVLDKALKDELLYFPVSENKLLEISLNEIIEFNEKVIKAEL
jgi:prolyl-tRNA editing enzyme YbaK/EbsC (Cys-tRNA(Pro) deacylase)